MSVISNQYTVKKRFASFPSPFLPRGSLVSDIPAGDGKLVNLFYGVMTKTGVIEVK